MLVTDVVPLDTRRCRICTDADVAFVLYKRELHKYRIESGQELKESTYSEILETVLMPRARERALYLITSHDRTEHEIKVKLREGGYPQEAIDAAAAFLREYGYVDDMEYGKRYVEIYGQRRSRRRVEEDLMRKGFHSRQIEELLRDGQVPEQEQVRTYLEKRGYDRESCAPETKRKLRMALLRRGYSFEAVDDGLENAEFFMNRVFPVE